MTANGARLDTQRFAGTAGSHLAAYIQSLIFAYAMLREELCSDADCFADATHVTVRRHSSDNDVVCTTALGKGEMHRAR